MRNFSTSSSTRTRRLDQHPAANMPPKKQEPAAKSTGNTYANFSNLLYAMPFPSLPSAMSVVLGWLDLTIQAVSCQRQLDFPVRLSTMAWPIQLPSIVVKMGY